MEIRRCDKCNAAINPTDIEHMSYGLYQGEVKALHVVIPVLKASMPKPVVTQGLDDTDEFGSQIGGRKIDLCSDCYPLLANMMTDWLK